MSGLGGKGTLGQKSVNAMLKQATEETEGGKKKIIISNNKPVNAGPRKVKAPERLRRVAGVGRMPAVKKTGLESIGRMR